MHLEGVVDCQAHNQKVWSGYISKCYGTCHRESPFAETNNSGGGFVGDTDVVRIEISRYESEHSSGE